MAEIRTLTVAQVSERLSLSTRTIYKYIKNGVFLNSEYSVIRLEERVRYRFYESSIQGFLVRTQIKDTGAKAKRTYNKSVVKNARKKVAKPGRT